MTSILLSLLTRPLKQFLYVNHITYEMSNVDYLIKGKDFENPFGNRAYTSSCLQQGSCLIYVICVGLRLVSNTYSVVFFVLLVFVLCALCCKFLWIVYFVLPLRYSPTFIYNDDTYKRGNHVSSFLLCSFRIPTNDDDLDLPSLLAKLKSSILLMLSVIDDSYSRNTY